MRVTLYPRMGVWFVHAVAPVTGWPPWIFAAPIVLS